ncbi:SPOR domain-containing protein [Porticoccus litoralis]|uniref:SPOR domain-containing protein n=1 Tax=Porticoccus litoralis TaxID=434086 RepID=A0AAW8B1D9_9GAMM|nr:SPOR domain-containing protein [Porticoccus litoralis]MDP1519394.1 SPOR domain-containing protein [Porticoccus litoralis]
MLTENVKQRIVGGFVLLALLLILFAVLFDFSDSPQVDTTSRIPPKPAIAPVTVPEPQRPVDIDPAPAPEEAFQLGVESAEQAEPITISPPTLTEKGLPESWVLQVGSFRDSDRAQTLVKQLQADGYDAFVQQQRHNDSQLNRVFVGPNVLKEKLLQEKAVIDKKYSLNALLVHFEP